MPSDLRIGAHGGREIGRPLAAAALLLGMLLVAGKVPAGAPLPFRPGERLTFQLRWLFVPAGQATLEILPPETRQGRDAFHFRMTASSNAFVDAVYPVRDRIDAWTDPGITRSLHYRKIQNEGSTHRDVTVRFDWEAGTARYATPTEKRDPIEIPPDTLDPLAVLYYARLCLLDAPDGLRRPVTDGKKLVMGRGRIVRRETIRLRNGRVYDTWLLEPELEHVGGVFRKSPGARLQLWVTADAHRVPVKVRSKVVVGSFTAELVAAEGTAFDH